MAIYWSTPGFKGRAFKLCVLIRWDFNFCNLSSPLRGKWGKNAVTRVIFTLREEWEQIWRVSFYAERGMRTNFVARVILCWEWNENKCRDTCHFMLKVEWEQMSWHASFYAESVMRTNVVTRVVLCWEWNENKCSDTCHFMLRVEWEQMS